MLRPETSQAAAGAAADVADEVTGDTPDNASRDEPTDPSWEADRETELDPGRVHGDDLQSDATRSEGEPDE
ncbi:MAG TPA: hypothetical protein VFH23_01225 [Jiangellaceae bacterium]|nr:hypothetical protein [Jiangellaceae bacterium]